MILFTKSIFLVMEQLLAFQLQLKIPSQTRTGVY